MEPDYPLHGADDLKAPASTLCAMFDHAVLSAPDKWRYAISAPR
jgi:hypothetical protein